MRAPRHWTIVERFDRFYVENQYGGFEGWHNDHAAAVAAGQEYVTRYGDTFDPGVEGSRPDWRDMDRGAFDTSAELGGLFDLTPDQVCAVDPCGTGDLLQLLEVPS